LIIFAVGPDRHEVPSCAAMPKSPEKSKGASVEEQRKTDIKRFTEVIQEYSKRAPGKVAPYVKQAAPTLATAIVYLIAALPYLLEAATAVNKFVKGLPEKIIYAALGFAVCFFGGMFPATIAAVEAWNICGGKEALACIKSLYKEALKVHDANEKDEKKDADGNGIADTKEMKPKDLVVRKLSVAASALDPDTVSRGMVGIYTGWIGVLAILKIRFAKTVTLGERIGEQVYRVACRAEPGLQEVLPEEYRKWVPMGVRWSCKAIAVMIAWWIERVIAAFHSAIRGGHLFGKYLVEFLHEKEYIKFTPEQAYLDEVIGWALAAVGLLFQFSLGFQMPFPLNLFLWPIQFVEGFIVWSVAAS